MSEVIDHGERAHSPWGASSTYRFFNCAGSITAQKGLTDTTSMFAAEGTAAHELSEKCLAAGTDAADYIGDILVVGNFTFECDEEFAEYVQVYLDVVRAEYEPSLGDVLSIEERFDLSKDVYPGAFGTADAVIWQPRNKRLVVIDLKFGKGIAVEVKGSPQLRYYALGALLKGNYAATEVEMIIAQPRAPHTDGPVRREVVDVMDLLAFKSVLVDAIHATLDENAPRTAGSWCKFCLAEGTCETRRQLALEHAKADFASAPAELDDDSLSEILLEARQIEDWVKAVRKEAFGRLAQGGEVPGFKLVAKRATRRWAADETIVASTIADVLDLDEDSLWARKMLSPAQVEKLIPRAQKKTLSDYIVSVSSGLTMAVLADKRNAVVPQPGGVADFEEAPEDDD